AVRKAARYLLPVAPVQHYETLPVVLEDGAWLISVSTWVLRRRLETPAQRAAEPVVRRGDEQPVTQDAKVRANGAAGRPGGRSRQEAVAYVRAAFGRNGTARVAVGYYYQEYILG